MDDNRVGSVRVWRIIYPNPIFLSIPESTRKISENKYPNPIQRILDQIRAYPKPELFVLDMNITKTQNPKFENM